MIETRHLKNVVIFIHTLLFYLFPAFYRPKQTGLFMRICALSVCVPNKLPENVFVV